MALNGSANATTGPTTPVTDRNTVSRVRMQTREIAPLPLVAGRVPTDADCDGIAEDFDADGTITDRDLQAFFERRGADSLRVQRLRFDANNDSAIDVHDVQAVLADLEDRGEDSPDRPRKEIEPTVGVEGGEITVPANGTRTVDVVVPEEPVGAFNLTVRAGDGLVSVVNVTAPGSEFRTHRNRTNGSVLVAAGHDRGDRIATVTLAGTTEGETSLVPDVAGISDDTGRLYAVPQDEVVSINVSTDAGSGGDGGGDDGGDDDGDGSGDDGPDEGTDDGPEETIDGGGTRESGIGGVTVLITVLVVIVAAGAGVYYLRQ